VVPRFAWPTALGYTLRFAARQMGLASGLALAVRPAGLAEAPGSTARRRRVPRSGMRSTVEAGGASSDNARRSGPGAVTSSRLSAHLACGRRPGRGAGGRGSGIRRGPQAASHRGRRARQPPPVGLSSEGSGESCRPTTASPRLNPSRLRPVTLAALSFDCSRPVLAVHGWGRQARRAEGAPLKP
jgi:hypothetical protein